MGKTRDYKSFSWWTIPYINVLIGFGWSYDWATKTPWTFDGEPVPYIGATRHSEWPLHWYILWLGPAVIQLAWRYRK